jgi:hypothetical protein
MKRTWRFVAMGVAALTLGGGAFLGTKVYREFSGPAVANCGLPSLPRIHFGQVHQLSSDRTQGARLYDIEPSAAVRTDGSLAVVYNTRDAVWKGTSGLATALVSLDGTAEVSIYENPRAEAFDAWMTATPNGGAAMVWLAHNGGRPEKDMLIGLSTSTDGRHWSTPPVAAHAPADCPPGARGCLDKPMIAATNGGVAISYCGEEGLKAVEGPLAAFAPNASVTVDDGCFGTLFVTPSNVVYQSYVVGASKERYGNTETWVSVSKSVDGGKHFEKGIRVSRTDEPVPFFFANPQVVMDEKAGTLYVAYPRGLPDAKWNIMIATSHDHGSSFAYTQVNDDGPCATHMTPHLALDPKTSKLHLSWLDNRDGYGALAYTTCEPASNGEIKCAANERINDAPFAKFSLERHLPAWLSEYGSLAIDAERRLIHAVWTQPVLENGDAHSRIFYASASLDK